MRRAHRIHAQLAASATAATAAILTAALPAWIESVFHLDPDGGNGSIEWLLVAGLSLAAISTATLALRHRRIAV